MQAVNLGLFILQIMLINQQRTGVNNLYRWVGFAWEAMGKWNSLDIRLAELQTLGKHNSNH
jgi:hypothetical protein